MTDFTKRISRTSQMARKRKSSPRLLCHCHRHRHRNRSKIAKTKSSATLANSAVAAARDGGVWKYWGDA
ncbi:hypothetical protein AMTR_s00129p00117890 [Amborella trichopoda]|uniref:Uncharacterized protein n=1 Tax=Amborella trichopoda TaxID=13333 RepID=W1NLF1_AMBTC|nr:hypothetical protein AMTR_s00129p00117890 [Amborella trichopoda]